MKPTQDNPINPTLDLTLHRIIDAPRAAVWQAWTHPDHLKQWWCPKPWQTIHAEIDLRPGGIFHTIMRGPDGTEHNNMGCYLEVIEGERIVFTDALGPNYRPTTAPFITAIITFTDHAGGTAYHAHVMHKDTAERERHDTMGFHEGWGAAATQLAEVAMALAKATR